MDPATLRALTQELVTDATNFTASRYLSLAGFVVLIYDHFLTLEDEIDLIWQNPLKPVSTLFLINRYVAPLVLVIDMYDKLGFGRNIPHSFCSSWLVIEGLIQTICFGITHALVALRVRALYSKERWLDWTLVIAGSTYLMATMIISIAADVAVSHNIYWDPHMNLCLATIPSWTFWLWIPSLLFETLLFALTAAKAVEHRRRKVSMPVTKLLYRDGFAYFIIIATCSIFNVIVWAALPSSLVALAKYFTFGIVNAMSSRLVLNLRALRRQNEDGLSIYPSHSGMEMHDYRASSYGPDFACAGLSAGHLTVSFASRHGLVAGSSPISFSRSPSALITSFPGRERRGTLSRDPSQPATPTRTEVRMDVDVTIEVDDGGYEQWRQGSGSDEEYHSAC